MKDKTEIIVLVVVLVLIYTRPSSLVRFSSTFLGKLILLVAVVVASLVSPLSGLLIATLMVLYTEQNYEGFKEGFYMDSSGNDINTNVIGDYDSGDTMIHLIDNSLIHNSGTGEFSITTNPNNNIFHENTIIKKDVPSIMITSNESITPEANIDFTIKSIPTDLFTTAAAADATAAAADAATAATQELATGQCSIFNITDSTTTTSIIRASSLTGMEANAISALNEPTETYLLTINSADYVIDTIVRSSILTLSAALKSTLKHGAPVTITKHSHPHGHKDGFEGLENKSEEDEKEDEETDEAVKNIMDKLDIGGIIDKVKDNATKTEGFFSGERKNVNEIAGAFAGELYESEISGTSECTTTICERIHREEQLIRPVNSNEELPRV